MNKNRCLAFINRQPESQSGAMLRRGFGKFAALALLGIAFVGSLANAASPLPGAIFTTDSTCSRANLNIYGDKLDVYLDGGPAHPGAASFPDGAYYVRVTDPSGADLLGTSVGSGVDQPFVVINGEPQGCYQLWAILIKDSDGTQGYDTTPNPGGEYKVWVSTVATFDNDSTKTDNFKVKENGGGPGGEPETARLCIEKFYDANANGVADPGEVLIDGWKFQITDGISLIRFTPICVVVEATNAQTNTPLYNLFEFSPVETDWVHTTPQTVSNIVLPAGQTKTFLFGNVCLGPGGGHTLGFWSNKNGQATMNDGGTLGPELALLTSKNLRNASGANYDPPNYASFRTWLLNATATNMAYMLSAQMAAMVLNVEAGFVNLGGLVYAPQLLPYAVPGLNALGFISINDLLNAANTELGLHGLVLAGDPNRAYQEALKNALDDANNNLNFVQPTPCPFSFAD
jgi:hypothetical protein